MRISHRFARLAVISFIAATAFISPGLVEAKGPPPPKPPPWAPCHGASCRGKDPSVSGCDRDARTIATAHDARGTILVELRYSHRCDAVWARTTVKAGFPGTLTYAQLGTGAATRRAAHARSVWSKMWTGPIKACGGVYSKGPLISACTAAK